MDLIDANKAAQIISEKKAEYLDEMQAKQRACAAEKAKQQKAIDDKWLEEMKDLGCRIIDCIVKNGHKSGWGIGRRNKWNKFYRTYGDRAALTTALFNEDSVSENARNELIQYFGNVGYGCEIEMPIVDYAHSSQYIKEFIQKGCIYIWIPQDNEEVIKVTNEISW